MAKRSKKADTKAIARVLSKLICGVLLTAVFAGVSIALFTMERPTTSDKERRKLAEKPVFTVGSLFSGEYGKALMEYYQDAVPNRDTVTTLSSYINNLFGFKLGGVEVYGELKKPVEEEPADTTVPEDTTASEDTVQTEELTADSEEETTDAPIVDELQEDGKADEGILTNNSSILVVNKRAIMLYGGGYGSIELYAESMNDYADTFGDGVQVYSMNIPTAVEYYLPDKYQSATNSQSEHQAYMKTCFSEKVKDVDVFEILREHKDEYIYLRTDHHWAPLGAYYAASVFAEEAGVPYAELSQYDRIDREGYVGSMYSYTQSTTLLENPDTFIYFKPRNSYTTEYYSTAMVSNGVSSLFFDNIGLSGSYCVYLGSDDRVTHITTDVDNDRVLCVIKDSFGNALIPFLTNSFEEIWVIDCRYFDVNLTDFVSEKGVTDVLVATCSFTCCGGLAKYFRPLLTQ